MKKLLSALFCTILVFAAVGCSKTTEEPQAIPQIDEPETITEQSSSVTVDDFVLTVYTDKNIYTTDEEIEIWADFKYIGSQDSIEIFHSSDYLVYTIFDGERYWNNGFVNTILISSILTKDVAEHHDFKKSGGWSGDDPDAAFWEEFYSASDLRLPAGEYTVTAHVDFSLSDENMLGTRNQFKTELQITVKE
ncbi:MAG: hypothetical protein FWD48_04675 [Oscillospiraceae bacterium]|nr:hypothetical protein [Oscillospiraceae bacterium]